MFQVTIMPSRQFCFVCECGALLHVSKLARKLVDEVHASGNEDKYLSENL
jgi:hypothetical protein